MKSFLKMTMVAAVTAVACVTMQSASGQTLISGWAVNSTVNGGFGTTLPPTTNDTRYIIGPLTQGSGIQQVTTAGVYGGSGWTNAGVPDSEANSIAHGLYLTYTIQAYPNVITSFTNFTLYYHNSATGPTNGMLQYSTDGITYSDVAALHYSAPNTAATTSLTNNLTAVAALQNVPSTTTNFFRIVNWGATGTAGTWYVNNASPVTMPDLQVIGIVGGTAVPTLPTISSITPPNVTTNAGSTVTFTLAGTTGFPPASNFWYKIVGSVTSQVPNAVSTTITLNNVLGGDAGSYFGVLSNSAGSVTSSVAPLIVTGDPGISSQPSSTYGLLDGTVQFSVTSVGTSPSYHWYFSDGSGNIIGPVGNGPQASGSVVSGAASSLLTLMNLQPADATNFVVIVTDSFGTVTSTPAALISVSSPAILSFWNFNQLTFPNNLTNPAAWFGAGTAVPVNVATQTGVVDPADGPGFGLGLTNFSWSTLTYPTNGNALSNKSAGVQFNVSTLGAKNVTFSYDARVSATASDYYRVQYTTNGLNWVDYPSSTTFNGQGTTYIPFNNSFVGFPGVANNPAFAVRVVSEYQNTATYLIGTTNNFVGTANTYGTGGTVTYDLVTFSGDAITNNNQPPVLGTIANTNMVDTNNVTLAFTASDDATLPDLLTYSATSLNPSKVSPTFTFGGSGANRTIKIAFPGSFIPDQIDAAPIEVTAKDASGDVTATWFYLTVSSLNLSPTNSLTTLASTNMLANSTNVISFKVGDDKGVGPLTYTVSSANNTLIPAANIIVGNTGTANPTLTIIPASNQIGVATIQVGVNDNDPAEPRTTTATFQVMVRPNTNVVLVDYFDYDNSGSLDQVAAGFWTHLSGTSGQMQQGSGVVTVDSFDNSENLQAQLLGSPYKTNSTATLYASFMVNMDPSKMPSATGSYFALFNDGSGVTGNYEGRLVAATNGAAFGNYRLGVTTFGASAADWAVFPQDLTPGVNYTVVMSLVLSNGLPTLWINPSSQASPSVVNISPPTAGTNLFNISDFELRESGATAGSVNLSFLKVGTTFDSVFPSLQVAQAGTNVIVNWSDPTLGIQSTTNLSATPFTDVIGAQPPYTNNASTNTDVFFRFGH